MRYIQYYYKKISLVLTFVQSCSVFALENTHYWRVNFYPINTSVRYVSGEYRGGVLKNNAAYYSITNINFLRPQTALVSQGIGFRHKTAATSYIKGVYLITDHTKHSSLINVGLESFNHVLQHRLNFYVPWTVLAHKEAKDFSFQFGIDYQHFRKVSPSVWMGAGIYSFYTHEPNWIGGIAFELKYNFWKKFECQGKIMIDTTKGPSFDMSVSVLNVNQPYYSTQKQLYCLPIERRVAPFQYFRPRIIKQKPYNQQQYRYTQEEDSLIKQHFNGMGIQALQEKSRDNNHALFRAVALKLHPDKNMRGTADDRNAKAEIFKSIQNIFEKCKIPK